MKIAIFGSGGVGGYFGGRLARSGEEVVFIARGEHLEAIQRRGLRVESVKGDFQVRSVQATDNPHEVGVVDVILVGVKAWQVPEVGIAMQPMVGPETFVIPLENGIEAPKQLAQALGVPHISTGDMLRQAVADGYDGIALNIVAAAIQATGSVRFTLVVPFDHNGVFHLVQMAAIVVLVAGVAKGLEDAAHSSSSESMTDAV